MPVREVALLASLALLAPRAWSADAPELDLSKYTLTSIKIPADVKAANPNGTSIPIRVRLLRTDRKEYRRQEVVTYDVSLENVSKSPVIIPWAPESAASPPRGTLGEEWLALEFSLARSGAPDVPVQGIPLHGAPAFPGTLRTLAPGERVIIRAPARLSSSTLADNSVGAMLSGPIDARARVLLMFGRPGGAAPVRVRASENSLPLRIVPTLPPVELPPSSHEPPVILAVTPAVVSPESFVRVYGYRLGIDRFLKPGSSETPPRFYLARGTARVPLVLKGRSVTGPDSNTSRQDVLLQAPSEIEPGAWNLVVVVDRHEATSPYPIEVSEWKPPHVERLSGEKVNPGDLVLILGSNFAPGATVEVTDSTGRSVYSGSSEGTSPRFVVDDKAADGPASVRIRVQRNGTWHSSDPFTFVITHEPLAPSLSDQTRRAVAAGQWTDLEGFMVTSWSERTEVEFTQGSRVAVTQTEGAVSPHVQVPVAMTPGLVAVRVRIWHGATASEWSPSRTYRVALSAVPPVVQSINVGPAMLRVPLQVSNVPARFDVKAGDVMMLVGLFPAADATPIPVTLERRGEKITLTSARVGSAIRVTVPARIDHGPWNVVVGSVDGSPGTTLPAALYAR